MHPDSLRGRGAPINPPNRFDSTWYEVDPDIDEPPGPAPETEYIPDHTKQIIATNDSPDIGFEASINPYRGCEHGCAYCFARPSHEYLGYSAGLDFESRIVVKYRAPELLRAELMNPRWQPKTLVMSGVTDCYQPVERNLQLTRGCVAVLAEFRNPVAIITKNRLVERDCDLLVELAAHRAAAVFVSITSLDNELIGRLEPRTSRPKGRLAAIRALTNAGVPCGVAIAPIIPGLTEHEMPAILEAAAEAGAKSAFWQAMRLPGEVAPIFIDWLTNHFPDRRERVLNRVREMRGGKLNESAYGDRMRPKGVHLEAVGQLFEATCRKLRLNESRVELSSAAFQRPGQQMALFG